MKAGGSRKRRAKTLWRVSVRISPESEEAAVELFRSVFGQAAAVYSDLESGTMTASVFVPAFSLGQRAELGRGIAAIRGAGLQIDARVTARRIARENWAESWKRHFKPLEISPRLLILPSWSRRRATRGQATVVLDPGLSFGTGHHPTTAFCLKQITRLREHGARQSLLDIGSGSGILSIAAAKLGYTPVVAFDFDPDAVRVAKENATANGTRIRLSRQDLTKLPERSPRHFDVVCANLIDDLLIQERAKIVGRLAAHGTLVVAGILKHQFSKVQRAFESAGVRLVLSSSIGEWRSGTFAVRD